MKQYSAQIRHSYETIVRMFRVQEDTFRFGRKMAMALCGLLMKQRGWRWIGDYALPLSLILGMASAIPITGWLS